MTQRSIAKMVLYTIFTFGIYQLFWLHSTKEEINARGADIPTMWWIIVPFVNIWWYWRYSSGVPVVTHQDDHKLLSFVMLLCAGTIGIFVIQWLFNRIEDLPHIPRAIVRETT